MILANVAAPGYFNVQEDRDSIKTHANVSVLNQGQSALMLRNLTMCHVSASAQINQGDVLILRFLMKNFANVCALRFISALEARGSMQTSAYANAPILDPRAVILNTSTVGHVYVSVLNQGQSALMLRNLTMCHASVSAQIDQGDVLILRLLMKNFANVCALRFISALEATDSMQTSAYVNAPILDPRAAILNTSTVGHVNVSVPILNQNAPSLKFSIQLHVSVNVPLLRPHAKHHTNLIQTCVPVSVHLTHALILNTLTVRHAVANVMIDTHAPRTRSLIKRIVNVSVPGWRNVGHRGDLTRISVSVNVPATTHALVSKYSIETNADVSATETPDVVVIKPLTTTAVIVYVTISVPHHMSWTRKSVIACVTEFAPKDINSIEIVSVFL